ncbi:hypothetical protein SERLADRAFT_475122, partial [Serpula lacrymans var. lacrymans S7.9]
MNRSQRHMCAYTAGMDSPITYVNSPAPSDASTILDFKRDVMTHTKITVRGDSTTCYTVETFKAGVGGVKTVVRQSNRTLAAIERRDILPDQVTLRDGDAPINLNKWLKSPVFSMFPITFEEAGKKYSWTRSSKGQLSLYEKGSEHKSAGCIAWFQPSRLSLEGKDLDTVSHCAYLALKEEADQIRDVVVVTCLLVEQKARMKDKAKGTKAINGGFGMIE